MGEFYLLTFKNTHDAIAGEKLFKEKKIMMEFMSTPTYITKSCGLSIRVSKELIEEVKALINKNEINVKNIYFYKDRQFEIINIESKV